MKNWIFADLKSVKIQNRRIELKFAGYATLSVTNTKRTIRGFEGRFVKYRIFADLKSPDFENCRF